MLLPWKVARNGRYIKTKAIETMKAATAVREPLQRSTTHYTGKGMEDRIGSSASNVESAMIQIVGEVSQQECTSAQYHENELIQLYISNVKPGNREDSEPCLGADTEILLAYHRKLRYRA